MGRGFQPGAVLELHDLTHARVYAGRKPDGLTSDRIVRRTNFGRAPAKWRVTVRNPDGGEAHYEFTVAAAMAPADASAPAAAGPAVVSPALPEPLTDLVPASSAGAARFAGTSEERDARQLLATGDARRSYALLAAVEPAYGGDPDYDYLLGVAALDSGHPSEAVFSLQRALAANPDFAGARMELARAYFEVGDNEHARREFQALRGQEPPLAAREAIDRYLAAVDRRSERYREVTGATVELSTGFDSNANGGTDDDTFLGFTLGESARKTDSLFYGVAGALSHSAPLTPRLRWQAGARAAHRANPDAPFVDATQGRISSSLRYGRDAWSLLGGVSTHWTALDGESNNRGAGLDLSLQLLPRADLAVNTTLRYGAVRYQDALSRQDVDQAFASIAAGWQLPLARRAFVEIGPLVGREDAREPGSTFSRDLVGARLAASIAGWRSSSWTGSYGWLRSDYEGQVAGIRREDDQSTAQLAFNPGWTGTWTAEARLLYVNAQSTVTLFQYDRVELGLYVAWGAH